MKLSLYIRTQLKKISKKSNFSLTEKQDQDLVFDVIGNKYIPNAKQFKYLGKFYNETEILITKIAFLLILISSITLGWILYNTFIITRPATGGEYVEAVVGAPTYINPLFVQTNDIDQDLSRLIFSSLMKLDENGQLIPDLVESYTIDEPQTTYTFTIKPNIKWHDNEPLTARDVAFTIESIQDQNFKSPLYVTFRNVQVNLIDEQNISLTLAEPFAPFVSVMTFGILPEHLWQEIEPSHAILAELNLKPIGSGPYQFSSFSKDKKGNIKSYTLKRNQRYYQEGPFIDKLTLKFFGNLQEAKTAFDSGNVDGIGFLPQFQQEYDKENLGIHKFSLPQYTALFFNQAANPVLEDKRVRIALALATNKQEIIQSAFGGDAEGVDSPILDGMVGYTPSVGSVLYDPAQSEKLLDEAGWKPVYPEMSEENQDSQNTQTITRGSNTLGLPNQTQKQYIRQKELTKGEPTTLEVTITTIQRDEMIKVAETIRELWQPLGIKVNVQIASVGKMQKEIIKPRAYEILLFGQILGRDPDPYPFWHSSQANDPGLNLALYNNKDVDELLEDARRTSDTTEREEKYITFQENLAQDVPAIFLYSLQYTYIVPQKIQGITTLRINHTSDRFSNITSWFIKTKKRFNFNNI